MLEMFNGNEISSVSVETSKCPIARGAYLRTLSRFGNRVRHEKISMIISLNTFSDKKNYWPIYSFYFYNK